MLTKEYTITSKEWREFSKDLTNELYRRKATKESRTALVPKAYRFFRYHTFSDPAVPAIVNSALIAEVRHQFNSHPLVKKLKRLDKDKNDQLQELVKILKAKCESFEKLKLRNDMQNPLVVCGYNPHESYRLYKQAQYERQYKIKKKLTQSGEYKEYIEAKRQIIKFLADNKIDGFNGEKLFVDRKLSKNADRLCNLYDLYTVKACLREVYRNENDKHFLEENAVNGALELTRYIDGDIRNNVKERAITVMENKCGKKSDVKENEVKIVNSINYDI